MVLDTKLSRQIRRLIDEGRLESLRELPSYSEITLAGSAEIALASSINPDVKELVDQCCNRSVYEMRSVFEGIAETDDYIAIGTLSGRCEARTIHGIENGGESWTHFLLRYNDALSREGFPAKLARSLAVAFEEMADNINRHSRNGDGSVPRHLAIWQVSNGTSSIALVDQGVGVKNSLARNPKWKDLPDDKAALFKAVRENASSKTYEDQGDGFDTFTSNFLSMGGKISVCSGNATIDLSGTIDSKKASLTSTSRFGGTMVFASCSSKSESVVL